jgi:hypothetical protein
MGANDAMPKAEMMQVRFATVKAMFSRSGFPVELMTIHAGHH